MSANAADDFKTALQNWLDAEPTESDLYNWSFAISTLKASGVTDIGIAGIMGNVKREAAGGIYAIEPFSGVQTVEPAGYTFSTFEDGGTYKYSDTACSTGSRGGGHGMVQWSGVRAVALIEFAEKSEYTCVTITHYNIITSDGLNLRGVHTCKIPCVAGQMVFILEELSGGYTTTLDCINKATNTETAARAFERLYEVSADASGNWNTSSNSGAQNYSGSSQGMQTRVDYAAKALPAIQACDKVIGSGSTGTGSNSDVAKMSADLISMGLWSEEQFVDFNSFFEDPIDLPNREGLDLNKIREITAWRTAIENQKLDKYNRYPRAAVMFVGILITLYSVILYLAWQFDRINNFIDIYLLSILTFKRFMASPDGTSNFSDTGAANKVLAHKDIIKVTLIGVAIGVLLISGKIFDIISSVVSWVSEHF